MDCSMPGFPVLPCLLELAQTHVHWVGDAIWLSHPLLPSSPFAFRSFPASGSFPVSHMNTSFPSLLFYFLTIFTISRLNIALWLSIVSSPLPLHKWWSEVEEWMPQRNFGFGCLTVSCYDSTNIVSFLGSSAGFPKALQCLRATRSLADWLLLPHAVVDLRMWSPEQPKQTASSGAKRACLKGALCLNLQVILTSAPAWGLPLFTVYWGSPYHWTAELFSALLFPSLIHAWAACSLSRPLRPCCAPEGRASAGSLILPSGASFLSPPCSKHSFRTTPSSSCTTSTTTALASVFRWLQIPASLSSLCRWQVCLLQWFIFTALPSGLPCKFRAAYC